ncbi:MAG: DNA topoisomerase VI subunit B [Candidatus Methanomethylicus sp.]|nr:DNA topoisomerase VI subunit B [Candidatus Methanomethylicus sp.]
MADTTIELRESKVKDERAAGRLKHAKGRASRKQKKRASPKPTVKELLTVAESEARKMRAVNPAQYYRQNLGQLGFGDPEHALVQTIKELMDNSLDACEAMGILPEIDVSLIATEKRYEVVTNKTKEGSIRTFPIFKVMVEDNGCGVIRNKVAKCFGKVLYGSKFFSFKQSRGQQGLGVHAAIIYAQLTSLEPAIITTKTSEDPQGYRVVLKIDTESNGPVVESNEETSFNRPHGTRVELMVAGDYTDKVESFIRELSLANPHAELKFKVITSQDQEPHVLRFKRANDTLPPQPKEIKPHLLSMEPGALLEMKQNDTCCKASRQFLVKHFVRLSDAKAVQILKAAGTNPDASPKQISVEPMLKAAREADLMRPPLDVLSPIGEEALRQSLKRMYPDAEYIGAVAREPWSYRGVPFQVEIGVAFGGQTVIKDCDRVREGVFKSRVIRLGNKCPLIYDSKDCLLYKVVKEINWRNYKISQDEGSLPFAPMVVIVSLTSTKVPYIVPGKFSVAYHEEIHEQLRLALQTVGRLLYAFISHRQRQEHEKHRQSIFQIYAKEVAKDLSMLTGSDENILFNKLLEASKHRKIPKPISPRSRGRKRSTPVPTMEAVDTTAASTFEESTTPEAKTVEIITPTQADQAMPVSLAVAVDAKPKKKQSTLEQFFG